jgi:hypothetical protein
MTEDLEESQEIILRAISCKKTRYTNKDKKRSLVWNHFNEIPSGSYFKIDGQMKTDMKIACKHHPCQWYVLDSKRKFSISNMKRHLENNHNIHENSSDKSSSSWNVVASKEELQKDIVLLIVTEDLPFTFVESPDFRKLLRNIPSFEIGQGLSATSLMRRIESFFDASRKDLKYLLDRTCETISLSLDIWSSSNNVSYLGVIDHWVRPDFVYLERLLDFVELAGIRQKIYQTQLITL